MSSRDRRKLIRGACVSLIKSRELPVVEAGSSTEIPVSSMPPFECFASKISETSALDRLQSDVRVGDVLAVKVKRCDGVGVYVRPLCFLTRLRRDLSFIELQLLAPVSALSRRLNTGEYHKALVVDCNPLKIEMIEGVPLLTSQLPDYFRAAEELPKKPKFWDYLEDNPRILKNPYLEACSALPEKSIFSYLPKTTKQDVDKNAADMRKQQDRWLAADFVKSGVEEMREGRYHGAIQQLDQAIAACPDCADAYVAKGAAHANQGNYDMAEKELEQALLIDPKHQNGTDYFVETLLIVAKKLEDQGKTAEAREKYVRTLQLKPDQRAQDGLDRVEGRKKDNDVVMLGMVTPEQRRAEERKKAAERQKKAEKRKEDKKKLEEMEAFIAALKNGKK